MFKPLCPFIILYLTLQLTCSVMDVRLNKVYDQELYKLVVGSCRCLVQNSHAGSKL